LTPPRLSAPERRQAVLDSACRIFSEGSYRGTTTAEIARESGVSEPILYRHFASKRELYLACLEAAWVDTRERWNERVAGEPDPARWVSAIAVAAFESCKSRAVLADLWIQALSEANDDPEIRAALSAQVREVHSYVADVIRRSQAAGGVVAERDAEAEAWIFVSVALLRTVAGRLGGLLGAEDLDRIRTARAEWMRGRGAEELVTEF
jgi:AcrR family transcriptional regulator